MEMEMEVGILEKYLSMHLNNYRLAWPALGLLSSPLPPLIARCTQQTSSSHPQILVPWSRCIETRSIETPYPTAARRRSSSTSRSTLSSRTVYGVRRVQVDTILPYVALAILKGPLVIFQSSSTRSVSIPSPKAFRGKPPRDLQGGISSQVRWLPSSLLVY